jgi:hypothetical protein
MATMASPSNLQHVQVRADSNLTTLDLREIFRHWDLLLTLARAFPRTDSSGPSATALSGCSGVVPGGVWASGGLAPLPAGFYRVPQSSYSHQ